jgi:hypothetical protein
LVKFTPFLCTSNFMQIKFECVCLTPLMSRSKVINKIIIYTEFQHFILRMNKMQIALKEEISLLCGYHWEMGFWGGGWKEAQRQGDFTDNSNIMILLYRMVKKICVNCKRVRGVNKKQQNKSRKCAPVASKQSLTKISHDPTGRCYNDGVARDSSTKRATTRLCIAPAWWWWWWWRWWMCGDTRRV